MDEHSKTDRNHLNAMLTAAKLPVNLVREFQTDEGEERMDGFWLMAVSGVSNPPTTVLNQIRSYAALQPQAAVAAASQAMPATTGRSINWEQVPGRAYDIAVAADGTVWVIGDNTVAGGRTIHYRGPNSRDWSQVQGGAVRIAVSGTTPWLVNDVGGIFERRGNNWTQLQGPKAVDIGASARGVWLLAEPANGQGDYSVYRRDGSSWARVQGASGQRIAVDAEGNPGSPTGRAKSTPWCAASGSVSSARPATSRSKLSARQPRSTSTAACRYSISPPTNGWRRLRTARRSLSAPAASGIWARIPRCIARSRGCRGCSNSHPATGNPPTGTRMTAMS